MTDRVLVAGIGNLFFGDDGFGVEVAHRLAGRTLSPRVHVEDYGIRGVHLAYDVVDRYDALVLVDAVPLGDEPGTLAVLAPDQSDANAATDAALDSHRMTPDAVLRGLAMLGVRLDGLYVVACQPETIAPGIGLSAPVAGAVERACDLVVDLVDQLVPATRQERCPCA